MSKYSFISIMVNNSVLKVYRCAQTDSNKRIKQTIKIHSGIIIIGSSAYALLGCSSQSYCYLLYSLCSMFNFMNID